MADKEFSTINIGHENFLVQDFKDKKFDIIIMNPPWTKYGIKFIETAVSLLKPGGKLVTIIGLNQFSPFSYDDGHQIGTFSWLNKKGTFERIETSRHDGAWGTIDFFNGKNGASCWFIWRNEKLPLITKMVNTLGEEFDFKFEGIEWVVPEEEYSVIKDIVDWSEDGLVFDGQSTESPTAIEKKKKNGIIPKQADPKQVRFKFGTVKGYEDFTGGNELKNCIVLPSDLTTVNVDLDKVRDFFTSNLQRKLALYARHITSYTRHYPIKKELFLKEDIK